MLLTSLASVSLPGSAVTITVGATAEGKEATVAVAGGFFALPLPTSASASLSPLRPFKKRVLLANDFSSCQAFVGCVCQVQTNRSKAKAKPSEAKQNKVKRSKVKQIEPKPEKSKQIPAKAKVNRVETESPIEKSERCFVRTTQRKTERKRRK